MRYKNFRIRNFKGIKDTTISFQGVGGASVFAFVGLNESGKTTILEAIHSFSPDDATSELLGGEKGLGVPIKGRVPRHQISSFTGNVSVAATLDVEEGEKERIIERIRIDHEIAIDPESFPTELTFERAQQFKDGDFLGSTFSLPVKFSIKGKSQRKWRSPTAAEQKLIVHSVYGYTPDIAYFPTFVFDFPERIFLTDRGNQIDKFYRRMFQDILDYDGKGYTIEKDIIRRVRSETLTVPWLSFFSMWRDHSDVEKIQHVMDRASATVTKVVFGQWNSIFGEDTKGKEVVITFDTTEGETVDKQGTITKTNEHDLYIRFKIRDGSRRFNVNDRSLGFRWFFAFMLFTQFRVARSISRPLLFLFDEPASNLHAAAQQKLIDCFPEIAKGKHALAYTTHSHYMIEPKWLEQTFIVTNRADDPPGSVVDAISLDDESLDVKAASYRSFVNDHPNQTSYFQPILDRLDVKPSRFDIQKAGVILEGKSDYYILRYAGKLVGIKDLPLLPGMGAGTFNALASMHVGWNLNFLFLLDGDGQGKSERKRYAEEFGIPQERLLTLDQLLAGVVEIEGLLDGEARQIIKTELQLKNPPSKAEIRRFFQERLASNKITDMGAAFSISSKSVLDALTARLD